MQTDSDSLYLPSVADYVYAFFSRKANMGDLQVPLSAVGHVPYYYIVVRTKRATWECTVLHGKDALKCTSRPVHVLLVLE